MADECSAGPVEEQLFGEREDIAGGVTLADYRLNGIFIAVVIHILLDVGLVGVITLEGVLMPQFSV